MKLAVIFAALLFASMPSSVWARAEQKLLIVPGATYNAARFELTSGATASYSGIGYGGDVAVKFGNELYSIAMLGGFSTLDLKNTANVSSQNETITGSIINIGSRFYGANLFIGLGVAYSSFTNDYVGTNSAKINYTALGVRLETGIDLKLGKNCVFTPKLNYDILDASPETSSSTKQRLKNFGITAGLGLEF